MALEIDNFLIDNIFASGIYRINKPEFLDDLLPVFNQYVVNAKEKYGIDPIYPSTMTESMLQDDRIEPFIKYLSDISWDVINSQGYNMDLFFTKIDEMWGQEHPYTSNMEYHSHNSILSGFYFLEVPENSSKIIYHDMRAAKMYCALPEREISNLTAASSMANYIPNAGDLFFANSWLPHSFPRNESKEPIKFIHFNINVIPRKSVPIVV